MKTINLIFIFTFIIYSSVFAETKEVAKVTKLAGNVTAQFVKGKTIEIEVNQSIPEGAVIKTSSRSFVKLIFNDKSELSLGPNSLMAINSFPKDAPGVLTLLRGQVRSQVTKDYGDIEDVTNNKLYIKTRSAALGVRGTDFQVNYNNENKNTSLITFEGKVAMSHLENSELSTPLGQQQLSQILNSQRVVMVERGHISAVNFNISRRAMIPTVLDPTQLNILNKQNMEPRKLPPGMDRPVIPQDPTGYFNDKTGEYRLPAGSVIDLKTVNIIPPPKDALLDPKTNVYKVPASFGTIDEKTGHYKAPEGLRLSKDGKFLINKVLPGKSTPRPDSSEIPNNIYEDHSHMSKFVKKFSKEAKLENKNMPSVPEQMNLPAHNKDSQLPPGVRYEGPRDEQMKNHSPGQGQQGPGQGQQGPGQGQQGPGQGPGQGQQGPGQGQQGPGHGPVPFGPGAGQGSYPHQPGKPPGPVPYPQPGTKPPGPVPYPQPGTKPPGP